MDEPVTARTSISDPGAALPRAHRLALLYLLLPAALWLLGWFRWWVGVPAVALLGLALAPALAGSWRGRPRLATGGICLLAWGWVMLTGPGGVFGGLASPWPDHHAQLLDLGRYPWPSFLPDDLQAYLPLEGDPVPLLQRYYFGWYLPPGLLARLWGPGALQWAVPLWTWGGVALILRLFAHGRRGWGALGAAALPIFFSGMDFLRTLLLEGWEGLALAIEFNPSVTIALYSFMALLTRDVQHFLPAGLYALLFLQLRRQPRFLAVSGPLVAAAPLWSPWVAIGLLPLLAALLRDNGARPFLRWPNLCLAGPLAGLIVLYLTAGKVNFPHGWMWEVYAWPVLARWMPVFYATEFLALAGLLIVLQPSLRREGFFLVSVSTLLLLPWYHYSVDDLLARAAVPSLFVLCYCSADAIGQGRKSARAGRGRRWARAGLISALAVGSLTPWTELARAVQDYYPVRYAQATWSLADMTARVHDENVAWGLPPVLRALLREPGRAAIPAPARGEPIVRGVWDVYWEADANRLIYVKAPCAWEQERVGAELFLQITPVVGVARAAAFTYRKWEASGDGAYARLNPFVRQIGDACGFIRSLPWPVAAFRTGQTGPVGSRWQAAGIRDTDGALVAVADRARRTVQATLRRDVPALRAAFHVYLDPDAVILARQPCAAADLQSKFFLHVVPFEYQDLPVPRQAAGFDNLDFYFPGFAVRLDERCWARIPLPAYGRAQLRIGQFAETGSLWRAEIPFAAQVPGTLDPLRSAYQAAAAQPPALRDIFDVHLAPDRVTFIKAPCRLADAEAKFVLHVFPRQRWRLPWRRWQYGFDNLSFHLEGHGARFDERCLARAALPAYPIQRLRVGQYLSRAQRTVWLRELPWPRPAAP